MAPAVGRRHSSRGDLNPRRRRGRAAVSGLVLHRRPRGPLHGDGPDLQAKLAKREAALEAGQRKRERVERVVATLQNNLGERNAALRLLSTSQVSLVRLSGLPPSPRANANLVWNP